METLPSDRATGPPASAWRSWQREETVGTPARAVYEKRDFNGFRQVKYYRKLSTALTTRDTPVRGALPSSGS